MLKFHLFIFVYKAQIKVFFQICTIYKIIQIVIFTCFSSCSTTWSWTLYWAVVLSSNLWHSCKWLKQTKN